MVFVLKCIDQRRDGGLRFRDSAQRLGCFHSDDVIRVTIPNGDLAPGRLNSFLDWLRLESVARRSALTEAAADELAESAKRSWWAANKGRFIPAEKQ